jgi:hypothetical protein
MQGPSAILALCLVGILPAFALGGLSPSTLFLVPLSSAAMASTAAILEFGLTGSITEWFVVVAITGNVGAASSLGIGFLRRRSGDGGRSTKATSVPRRANPARHPAGWPMVCTLGVLVAVGWPLIVLKAPVFGYDTQAIWLIHTALVWAGHNTMLHGLTNPAYRLSNPDYPPLVPAVGALVYSAIGHIDERSAVTATVILNACAVGVVGTGLLRIVPPGATVLRRSSAVAMVFVFCGASFGIAGSFGVNGYADMLWSSAALGATVFGLVLPRTWRHATIAWLCIVVSSTTKNEGLIVNVVISVLIAVRYTEWGQALAEGSVRTGRPPRAVLARSIQKWVRLAAMALGPLIPGTAWLVLIHRKGIHDAFFSSESTQALSTRLEDTGSAISRHIFLAPAALVVLVLGSWTLGTLRSRLGLASPAWLWSVAVAALVVIIATYAVGSDQIQWWLSTSVARTTIFDQMAVITDMTVWSLVLIGAPEGMARSRTAKHAHSRGSPVAQAHSRPLEEVDVSV